MTLRVKEDIFLFIKFIIIIIIILIVGGITL